MARVTSAAALVAVLILVVWFGPPWASLTLGVVAALVASAELVSLGRTARWSLPVVVGALSTAVVTAAFALDAPIYSVPTGGTVLPVVLLATVVLGGAASLASGDPGPDTLATIGLMGMAPLYIGLPLGVFVWVRGAIGREALLLPPVVVAASDTAQYYAGRSIGRRKLAPRLSPAKTVEGAMAGLIVASIVGALLAPQWLGLTAPENQAVPPILGASLGLVLGLGGVVGDLFESFLKRSAGVKDSSGVLPGHGGVLDRLDSHLFAAPLYYLFLRYLS